MHIFQKYNENAEIQQAYTVVITDGYGGEGQEPLSKHPSIMSSRPLIFEISNDPIPDNAQYLNFKI